MMTNEQKKQVRDALARYAANFETQAEAAASLRGVNAATISQVKNNNWELLNEQMWYHLARQVGFFCGEWQPADTETYMLLRILLGDAQHYGKAYGIAMNAGMGKTFAAAHYVRENGEAIYISGKEDLNQRSFMERLLRNIGIAPGRTLGAMTEQMTAYIAARELPLLIVDDTHKLKTGVLNLLVQLVSSLEEKAGIIIMGNMELPGRIVAGMQQERAGYEEVYLSIGQRFISLQALARHDVELVCRANGVTDAGQIADIARQCGNDLHKAAILIDETNALKIAA